VDKPDSDNWYEHENSHGFRWLGMQPTATGFNCKAKETCQAKREQHGKFEEQLPGFGMEEGHDEG
jgi:hypothetical protein